MTAPPDKRSGMSSTRLALLAQQLRPQRELLGAEPIAVVGMSGRFPGGGQSPEGYWQLLAAGRDAVREVPPERFDIDAHYDPTPGVPGKIYTRWGAFIDGVDQFDAEFFGIPPRDADDMDPQQRMLLEDCWWALERAGLAAERLVGTRTGVFVGMMHIDYNVLGLMEGVEARAATLNYLSAAAGRIAYQLGLQGPTVALDTACSSSLVAVHLACQALRDGECELALAGGVSLILSPLTSMFACGNRMLAPDGRCKTFDAAADGFVRGEGSGVVALRRLADALAAGDPILAVIRGSAVNHDGRSSGIMVPSGRAQEKVIRAALATCGVTPAQISYVEAHGTGTALGDPIELEALGSVFAGSRPDDDPLWVGSVKTNIGHTEAAAGIASLIKVILALQHERVPPHLNFSRPTPNARWDTLGLAVPQGGAPWPRGARSRIASINSFGLSGTNAHMLVEEAPALPARDPGSERPAHVMVLSARNPAALAQLVHAHDEALARLPADAPIADWCHTINVGRNSFEHRAFALGATAEQLRASLAEIHREPARAPRTVARTATRPRPVFLFTGQGSQHPGMGRELFATQPVFRAMIERCSAALAPLLDLRLEALLFDPDHAARLDDARLIQPAMFAFAVSLAALWRAWGIEPAAVIGHSLGEYAAACVAGVLEVETGLQLIAARGRLCHASAPGGMLAVSAPPGRVDEWLQPWADLLSLAARNGPEDVVVSGQPAALAQFAALLDHHGVRHRPLPVTRAYHSPLLQPILADFRALIAAVPLTSPRVPLISNLDGQPAGERLRDPDYWCRHLREPVRFADGLRTLLAAGHTTFLELGPAPVLSGLGLRLAGDRPELAWLPSLRGAQGETRSMLAAAGELHVRGCTIDWRGFDAPFTRHRCLAPTYPFQRARHWQTLAPQATPRAPGPRPRTHERHPLLGDELALAGSDARRFDVRLDTRTPAWIGQHRVLGGALLPAAAYLELALAGLRALAGRSVTATVEALVLERPLAFTDGEAQALQLILTPEPGGAWRFEAHVHEEGRRWSRLAHARVLAVADDPTDARRDLAALRRRLPRASDPDAFYARLRGGGLDHGETFRTIDAMHLGDGEALVHLRLTDDACVELDDYVIHPALLDGCLQAAAAAVLGQHLAAGLDPGAADPADARPWMPVELARLRTHARVGAAAWVHVHCRADPTNPDALAADITVHDNDGNRLATLDGLGLRRMERRALTGALSPALREWLFELEWPTIDRPPPASARAGERWLLLAADDDPLGPALTTALAARDVACVRASPPAAPPPGPFTGVVLLADPATRSTSDSDLPAAARGALHAALLQLHALVRADLRAPTWWLTRDAVAVAPHDALTGLLDAALWGLGRAAQIEHPALDLRMLDLPPRLSDPDLPALVDLLLGPPAENLLALRPDGLHAARLQPSPARLAGPRASPLRPDATYLITGGLGGLGLESAEALVLRGARRLVLLGRGEPTPGARARIDLLRARDVEVTLARADVGDEAAMRELLAAHPELGGIIHAAGVLDDGVLLQQDARRIDRVCRPKLDGAWLLHRLTRDRPLDCFVLYSSAAALIGVGGQANYLAANTFLAALAHHRRAAGLPALTIDWGAWTGVGMAADLARTRRGAAPPSIAPAKGRLILGELLAGTRTQVGVLPLGARHDGLTDSPAHAPLFRGLIAAPGERGRRQDLLAELADAELGRRHALLARYLGDRLSALLGLGPGQAPGPDSSPAELGVDSLMAIELKNRIGRELGVEIASDRLIDGTSLAQLVELLHVGLELGPLRARRAAGPDDDEELLL